MESKTCSTIFYPIIFIILIYPYYCTIYMKKVPSEIKNQKVHVQNLCCREALAQICPVYRLLFPIADFGAALREPGASEPGRASHSQDDLSTSFTTHRGTNKQTSKQMHTLR